jgi:hypothetical protein
LPEQSNNQEGRTLDDYSSEELWAALEKKAKKENCTKRVEFVIEPSRYMQLKLEATELGMPVGTYIKWKLFAKPQIQYVSGGNAAEGDGIHIKQKKNNKQKNAQEIQKEKVVQEMQATFQVTVKVVNGAVIHQTAKEYIKPSEVQTAQFIDVKELAEDEAIRKGQEVQLGAWQKKKKPANLPPLPPPPPSQQG